MMGVDEDLKALERKREEIELPPPSWVEVAKDKSREELLKEADELEWELTPQWQKLTCHSLQAIKRTPGMALGKTCDVLGAAAMGMKQVSPIVWLLGGAIGFDIAFVIGCLLLL